MRWGLGHPFRVPLGCTWHNGPWLLDLKSHQSPSLVLTLKQSKCNYTFSSAKDFLGHPLLDCTCSTIFCNLWHFSSSCSFSALICLKGIQFLHPGPWALLLWTKPHPGHPLLGPDWIFWLLVLKDLVYFVSTCKIISHVSAGSVVNCSTYSLHCSVIACKNAFQYALSPHCRCCVGVVQKVHHVNSLSAASLGPNSGITLISASSTTSDLTLNKYLEKAVAPPIAPPMVNIIWAWGHREGPRAFCTVSQSSGDNWCCWINSTSVKTHATNILKSSGATCPQALTMDSTSSTAVCFSSVVRWCTLLQGHLSILTVTGSDGCAVSLVIGLSGG